jgi:hypothetical protein
MYLITPLAAFQGYFKSYNVIFFVIERKNHMYNASKKFQKCLSQSFWLFTKQTLWTFEAV